MLRDVFEKGSTLGPVLGRQPNVAVVAPRARFACLEEFCSLRTRLAPFHIVAVLEGNLFLLLFGLLRSAAQR